MQALADKPRLGFLDDTCRFCNAKLAYLGREVACSACHAPVPPDHPLQKELDAGWKAREAADREEREKQAKAAPGWQPEYLQTFPSQAANDQIIRLSKIVESQGKQLAAMEKRLAALEGKKGK